MTKLEQAQQIVRLNNEVKRLESKLEFTRDGRFKDEFIMVYTQNQISEYSPNIELTKDDIIYLRQFWEESKHKVEVELNKLLGD